jgi:hypothetical protein
VRFVAGSLDVVVGVVIIFIRSKLPGAVLSKVHEDDSFEQTASIAERL